MNYLAEKLYTTALLKVLEGVVGNDLLREKALSLAEKKAYEKYVKINATDRPVPVQLDKYYIIRNMLRSISRALESNSITKSVRIGLLKSLGANVFLGGIDKIESFRKRFGFMPPSFLTISPTRFCNLNCKGCYATSSSSARESLDYKILDRIINEKIKLWGGHFTVISGGEPFLYKSGGKTILDLAREHSDNFFLIYTNGTLIDKKLAKEIADAGNISPAISVEGFEKETDERRGKGVYRKILKAFENLRNAGVPFGISATALNHNADIIVSDEFIDYYFNKEGIFFCWLFQYMPIGREYTLEYIVTPEQRMDMFFKTRRLIKDRGIFIIDFWNCGTISSGCISAGRGSGGYFYIDWNGNATPCVFNPYSTHNVIDVFNRGGDLNDIVLSPYFSAIRKWQNEYSYTAPKETMGNQIRQCAIRDHYSIMREMIDKHNAQPTDNASKEALEDEKYYEGMISYEEKFASLVDPIWEEIYLKPGREKEKNTVEKENRL